MKEPTPRADLEGGAFSFDKVQNFDEHIGLSIPNYSHIHELVLSLACWFIKSGANVYDLGCSTGSLLRKLAAKFPYPDARFIGYDISENLLPEENTRPRISYFNQDITKDSIEIFPNAQLIISLFTIQFLPLRDRPSLLSKIYRSLNPGGGFIWCEKIYLPEGYTQDMFSFAHYDLKRKAFSPDQILDKEQRLREIMRPQTESENITMALEQGFKGAYPFFQSLNFKGWILLK